MSTYRVSYAEAPRPRSAQRPAARRPAQRPPQRGNVRRPYNPGPGRDPRRVPPRRRRRWRLRPAGVALLVVVALVVVGGVALIARHVRGERFVDNVSINGVSLSGYTRDEGYALMEQKKNEWLNATYTLTYDGRTWDFSPASVNAQINFDSELERAWNLGHVGDSITRRQVVEELRKTPAELVSEITYDQTALSQYIQNLAAEIDVAPVDAEVSLTETKPVITRASQTGTKLDRAKTRENLISLITTGQGDTRLPVETVEPGIASDDMEMRVVAKFSTDVSFRNYDSRYNVRLALNYFNCFQVNPGDTVDFNEVVGPRSEAAGFRKAPEYAGNETIEGVGGGVCQASTTLYNAAVMMGMSIIERHNHGMTVAYVEPSQDAAVEYGGKNFVFRNDTEYTYYIYTDVTGETANITVYGTRPQYHYVLESNVLSEKETDRKRYEPDEDGKYCYYTDETKLKLEGHGSCTSEGWIVSYDWNTKEEVSREKVSYDEYRPGMSVYWRGTHKRK